MLLLLHQLLLGVCIYLELIKPPRILWSPSHPPGTKRPQIPAYLALDPREEQEDAIPSVLLLISLWLGSGVR